MLNFIKIFFEGKFQENLKTFTVLFRDYTRAEAIYLIASFSPIVTNSFLLIVTLILISILILSLILGMLISSFYIIPYYLPNISPLHLLVIYSLLILSITFLLAVFVIKKIKSTKNIFNKYQSHWV